MPQILQTRLQQYMNQEFPDVQAGFKKGRGTKVQIANIWWIIKKARASQRNIYFCFIDYAKAFHSVDHNKLENYSRGGNIWPPTCFLRHLHAGQEVTELDWFQIGKEVHQGWILSPWLFNLYAEYIVQNAGLDEPRAGIKIAGRNINNLRYTDDTTLWQKAKKN